MPVDFHYHLSSPLPAQRNPGANNFTRQHVPTFLSSLTALTAVCISSANLYGTLPSFDPNVVNTMVKLRLDNNALSGRRQMQQSFKAPASLHSHKLMMIGYFAAAFRHVADVAGELDWPNGDAAGQQLFLRNRAFLLRPAYQFAGQLYQLYHLL